MIIVIATMQGRDVGTTGVHTHVRELRGYLETSGVEHSVIRPYMWGGPLIYPVFGFRVLLRPLSKGASLMWNRVFQEFFLRKALARCLAETGECVVYAQGPQEARAALRARKGQHQRVVMVIHSKVSAADEWASVSDAPIKKDGFFYRALRRIERETIPRLDGIVAVSQWARQAVLDWLPEAAAVPYAVITNFSKPMHPEPSPGPLADIVSTGHLDIVKNHTYLLDVLAAAKQAGHVLTLDVYGTGLLLRELDAKARSLGLETQVRWRGFCPDIRDFLPGYRVYAHASYWETSSLAIIEAMAAGLPIMAGKIGGVQELFDDGVEGRFWPLDDPSEAAALLIDLLVSEPTRSSAADAARKRFYRDYDSAVVVPRLLAFLQQIRS
jgi:glycosyltransferase involved in cell wall biosynthesis